MGVALVFRLLPLLRADMGTIRDASAARLATERGLLERTVTLATLSLERAFDRADRLSLALQARCFAWNPTLPPLSMSWLDLPAFVLAVGLIASAFV